MTASRKPSRLKLATLLLALTAIAAPAWADGGRHGHGNDRNRNDRDRHGHDRRHDDRGDRHRRGDHVRYVQVPGWRQPAFLVSPRVYRQRYAAPPTRVYYRNSVPRWQRGTRYYGDGYGPTYVVRDYGYYGLRQPPRGYYWRRDDRGGFLLVAVASGLIADLVLRGGY